MVLVSNEQSVFWFYWPCVVSIRDIVFDLDCIVADIREFNDLSFDAFLCLPLGKWLECFVVLIMGDDEIARTVFLGRDKANGQHRKCNKRDADLP